MPMSGGVKVSSGADNISSDLANGINALLAQHDPEIRWKTAEKLLIATYATCIKQEGWDETLSSLRELLFEHGPKMAKEYAEVMAAHGARLVDDEDGSCGGDSAGNPESV